MTVATTINKIIYAGDDVSTEFPFTFRIFEAADLVVTRYTIADGTEETLVLDVDYTVEIDGEAGGTVTLTDALADEYKLIIRRVLDLKQGADYVENDFFPANIHEGIADRLTMIAQQLQEILGRCMKIDAAQEDISTTLPVPAAGQYIKWNDTADGFTNASAPTSSEYDGTISHGADADKPASPGQGDVYFATDTGLIYVCKTAGSWAIHTQPGSTFSSLSEIPAAAGNIPAANLGNAVLLTGGQSVGGVKVFTDIPVLPANDPTLDNQAVRKSYADNLIKTDKARAYQSASAQSINTGTDTQVTLDAESFDTNNCFAANTFTAKKAAEYHVIGQVQYQGTQTGKKFEVSIRKTDALYARESKISYDASSTNLYISAIVALDVDDTIKLYTAHNADTAKSLNNQSYDTSLSVIQLPPDS